MGQEKGNKLEWSNLRTKQDGCGEGPFQTPGHFSCMHPTVHSISVWLLCQAPCQALGMDGVATGASRLQKPTIQRRGGGERRGHRKWQVYDLESSR